MDDAIDVDSSMAMFENHAGVHGAAPDCGEEFGPGRWW